ncbi:uncharacterized protein F5891DRAFT_1028895, partial [Suillus fuscotomentosus]
STTAPQQASTSPGDGAHIPAEIRNPSEVDYNDPNINVVEVPAEKKRSPTFKEQTFGKPNVKEHGEQVLRGEETIPVKRRRGSTSD